MLSFFLPRGTESHVSVKKAVELVTQRVRNLLSENGLSFTDLCLLIERAENKNDLKLAFNCFNRIMWSMSLSAPLTEQNGIIFHVLKVLNFSDKFGSYLSSAPTPHQAIRAYKTAVVQELAAHIRQLENFKCHNSSFEDDLFSTYFPTPMSHLHQVEGSLQGQLTELCQSVLPPCRKRGFSKISQCGTGECAEIHPDSKSGQTHSTFKETNAGSKRRRCQNSTYKGKFPSLSSPVNRKSCNFKHGKCPSKRNFSHVY